MTTQNLGKHCPEISSNMVSPSDKTPKSPMLKSISTMQRNFRIGRSPNYISTTPSTRTHISPNPSYRRYSMNEMDFTRPESSVKFSNEHIFDMMEREQDGIVLKLMKEISSLREENRSLKSNINGMNSLRRSSSLSSNRSSVSSGSTTCSVASKQNQTLPTFAAPIFNKDEFHDSRKKFKRRYSNEIPPPTFSSFNDFKVDHNLSLKDENDQLKREIKMLKTQLSARK